MHMNSRWSNTQGKVWEGSEHRGFCPCVVGMHHPPGMDMVTHLEALHIPYCREFMGASSRSHDQFLTSFLAPLPSQEDGGGYENSKLLIMAGPSGDQPLSRSHPGAHAESPH